MAGCDRFAVRPDARAPRADLVRVGGIHAPSGENVFRNPRRPTAGQNCDFQPVDPAVLPFVRSGKMAGCVQGSGSDDTVDRLRSVALRDNLF